MKSSSRYLHTLLCTLFEYSFSGHRKSLQKQQGIFFYPLMNFLYVFFSTSVVQMLFREMLRSSLISLEAVELNRNVETCRACRYGIVHSLYVKEDFIILIHQTVASSYGHKYICTSFIDDYCKAWWYLQNLLRKIKLDFVYAPRKRNWERIFGKVSLLSFLKWQKIFDVDMGGLHNKTIVWRFQRGIINSDVFETSLSMKL